MKTINLLGIDVKSKDTAQLKRRLKALKSTFCIRGPYAYREDRTYSQVLIDTEMTESQLDEWLYRVKHGADYVGVFTRKEGE